MPLATWSSNRYVTIDGVNPTVTGNAITVGTIAGGAKGADYRTIIGFDLGQPPDSGVPPASTTQIIAATLTIENEFVSGAGGWPGTIARITRADWAGYPGATWNNYKAGTPWTTPGGDVDAGSAVAFTSPTAVGTWVAPGLAALAADAIDHRDGLLSLHLRKDTEDTSETAQMGRTHPPYTALLTVTYAAADAGHTIDMPDPPSTTIGHGAGRDAPTPSASAGRSARNARPAQPHHPTRRPTTSRSQSHGR